MIFQRRRILSGDGEKGYSTGRHIALRMNNHSIPPTLAGAAESAEGRKRKEKKILRVKMRNEGGLVIVMANDRPARGGSL